MKVCERCKKKYLFPSQNPALCRRCFQENEILRIHREQEEKKRLQEEKELQIADTKRAFTDLEESYKTIKKFELSDTDSLKQVLALCELFSKKFHEFMNMQYVSEAIQAERYLPDDPFVEVGAFGLLPYEDLGNGNARVKFDEILDEVEVETSVLQARLVGAERFQRELGALRRSNISVENDPGETKHIPLALMKTDNITKRSLSKVVNYIVVDVETTGLSPEQDEVIELAAIKFINFQPDEVFHTYLKPRHGLKARAQEVNHITEDMVKDAPYFEQISDAFNEFIGETLPIVGHNLPFDYRFITAIDGRQLVDGRKFYDTLDLAKREYGFNKNSLDYLCSHVLHVARDNSHSAASDALVTGYLFRDICERRIGDIYSQFCNA